MDILPDLGCDQQRHHDDGAPVAAGHEFRGGPRKQSVDVDRAEDDHLLAEVQRRRQVIDEPEHRLLGRFRSGSFSAGPGPAAGAAPAPQEVGLVEFILGGALLGSSRESSISLLNVLEDHLSYLLADRVSISILQETRVHIARILPGPSLLLLPLALSVLLLLTDEVLGLPRARGLETLRTGGRARLGGIVAAVGSGEACRFDPLNP
mmetsp:Transcript_140001/g.447768  ORF Transcript_140001/g.447768 Transcript_140001/m.447768 type:complete len:207 (+) Transcript_140001:1108-1728(+)